MTTAKRVTPDKKTFGSELRAWRTASSMTLKDMVTVLGMRGYRYTIQAVSAWERGESAPPADVVKAIEGHLGIAQGTLGIHLGYPAGDPLNERLDAIEARQDRQELALREILARLPEPPAGGVPRPRGRR